MTRRRALILSLLTLLVSACGAVAVMAYPTPGVTRSNFRRLHVWMKEKDAVAILGREADESVYVTGGYIRAWKGDGFLISLCLCWSSDGLQLMAGNVVVDGEFVENLASAPTGESVTDRLRRWLRF
jgi:hypothetical protein